MLLLSINNVTLSILIILNDCLVFFLTILKNIKQWEGLSHILWKINMFQTTNQIIIIIYNYDNYGNMYLFCLL